MTTIKIEFDANVAEATVNGKTYQVDLTKVPNASLVRIFRYGMQRIVNDRCGGADKTDDDKAKTASGMIEAILSGDIATRRASSGEPALNAYIRKIVRKAMGEASKAKYDAIPSDDQAERATFLMSLFTGAPDDVQAKIMSAAEEAMATDLAERERAKKVANAITI